jgi:LysM repeat protein
MFVRGLSLALVVAALAWAPGADAEGPKTHTVYRGQNLGMIAKRYNVSVEALCTANGISRSAPIKPGQKLAIPGADDASGAKAARSKGGGKAAKQTPASAPGASKKPSKGAAGDVRVHVVYTGQNLGMIARRYNVTVDALCHANGISRRAAIQPDQRLIVPAPGDADGSAARRLRLSGKLDDDADAKSNRGRGQSWHAFQKPAWRRGFITLKGQGKSWKGYVLGPKGQVLPLAQAKVSDALASWRTGESVSIDSDLVRMIAKVSDTFGGRPIHVVSGYREHSHSPSSRHKTGKALDFRIEGVPNWAVRDYLRSLDGVGVGFYPNSTFVHLDVREDSAYWVDHSGPGEAPRYARH